jgi:hypothetical protein
MLRLILFLLSFFGVPPDSVLTDAGGGNDPNGG